MSYTEIQKSVGRKDCNFFKKETLTQVFSCEFCEISKNTFFTEHVWATAFDHIKKTFETSTGSHPVFFLAELRELFNKTYQQYTNKVCSVHQTRFKNDLLKYMPSLKAFIKGKNVLTNEDTAMDAFFRKLGKV